LARRTAWAAPQYDDVATQGDTVGLRVAVVGGGLGGLCLAQGLCRADGVDVTVYERDPLPAGRRQGYRLHVDARAGLALERCLPPELFELFLATCGDPGRRFTVVTENLKVLHEVPYDASADPFAPATLATSVDRRTLREVLASGLEERIVYGSELSRYEMDGDVVRLHFADGREAEADVLVGADGVNSAVRRQYLPRAKVTDTGSRCVYGRTPLTPEALELLPAPLHAGFMAVVGGPVGMAAGLVRFRRRPEEAAAAIAPSARLSPAGDYLMWAVSASEDRFGVPGAELSAMSPAELHARAAGMIKSWNRNLRTLQSLAEVDETFLVHVRSCEPTPAWQPSRVTVLGDAIHAMSPARGSGANTALQDAGELCTALTGAAAQGGGKLLEAIGEYETRMREYGYAAVAASRQAEAEMGTRRSSLMFWLYRRLSR
jgi:2-polyprenyl-6-methoxyphenol hydroxylase-like FAD-dependent oxidoreductase